jgi:hypothetical protein
VNFSKKIKKVDGKMLSVLIYLLKSKQDIEWFNYAQIIEKYLGSISPIILKIESLKLIDQPALFEWQ